MVRLILVLIVAVLVAFVAVWFADNPGSVVLDWRGYRIETSVGVTVLAALVFALVVAVLALLLRGIIRGPKRFMADRRRARELRGYRELSSGIIAAAAGDNRAARAHGQRAQKLLADEPALLLLDAQTAQLEGDEERALISYQSMLKQPETEFFALRGLLGQSMKLGDSDEGLELARKAFRHNPEAPWTATTLFDLLTQREHWSEALDVADALARTEALDPGTLRRHRAALQVLVGRERLAAKAFDEARRAATQAYATQSSFTPAALLLADVHRELGRVNEAQSAIEKAWAIRPHPELARAYFELAPEEQAGDRLRRFDRLRRRHPDHAETRLTMAELALAAGDLALAREQLEGLAERGLTARGCRLMAELERAGGGSPDRVSDWLLRAADATPDPAWVCEDTGEVFPSWRPFGGTRRFNTVTWTTPPTLAPMLAGDGSAGVTITHAPESAADGGTVTERPRAVEHVGVPSS